MANANSSDSRMPNLEPMMAMARRVHKTKRGLTKQELATSLGWGENRVGDVCPMFAELAILSADAGDPREVPLVFPTKVDHKGRSLDKPIYIHEDWASDDQKRWFLNNNWSYAQTKVRRNAGRAEVDTSLPKAGLMKRDYLAVELGKAITALEQAKLRGATPSQLRPLKSEYKRLETEIRELVTA